MRMVQIVVDLPFVDLFTRVSHRQEPGSIQALLAKPIVKRFDVGVIRWFSGSGEGELDLFEIGPLVKQPAGELRPVVDPDAVRFPAQSRQANKFVNELIGSEVYSGRRCESFSRKAVDDR
jgi:hypothetical protein